jgi:hypothetical protein
MDDEVERLNQVFHLFLLVSIRAPGGSHRTGADGDDG